MSPQFRITVDRAGNGTILLDGNDISGAVCGIHLETSAHEPTVLTLEFVAVDVEVDGSGIVTVETGDKTMEWREVCACDCGCEPCDNGLEYNDPEQWHSESGCSCRVIGCECVLYCGCNK